MAKHLTIGELAGAGGVPTSTIRYYERERLLQPSSRSPSNYRLYSAADLERLRFIRAAQATGFTLHDVSKLLRPAPCGSVQRLIEERLDVVVGVRISFLFVVGGRCRCSLNKGGRQPLE